LPAMESASKLEIISPSACHTGARPREHQGRGWTLTRPDGWPCGGKTWVPCASRGRRGHPARKSSTAAHHAASLRGGSPAPPHDDAPSCGPRLRLGSSRLDVRVEHPDCISLSADADLDAIGPTAS